MTEPQHRDHLPADWSGEIDELIGFEDQLSDHDVADRVFIDRAEAFAAGRALAVEAARREHAAQADGQVVAHRPAGHIEAKTLLAARIDPFAAAQWEVGCELQLGDGSRIPIVIDINTATALGQALIAQAAISTRESNAEFDWQASRHERRLADREHTQRTPETFALPEDELPF